MESKVKNINYLLQLHEACFQNNVPFVSYRIPGKTITRTLLQTNSYPRRLDSLKELNNSSGFVITPFFSKVHNASFILEPDVLIENNEVDPDLIKRLKKISLFNAVEYLNGKGIHVASENEFIDQVNTIKENIRNGMIRKAVLSRIHTEPKKADFSITQLFNELCDKYPNAFVYLFQIPNAGCWVGATPEPLVLAFGDTIETISLAATQRIDNKPVGQITWKTKELEEQHIVTEFIEKVLTDFNVVKYEKTGPFTQVAGNIVHLKTRFVFENHYLNSRMGEFIEALHPTPSICGLPKDKAFGLLEKIEPHHREYYTGLLGPVNMNNSTSLYVNLRCMKVLENRFALYLGAGITSGSVPESEWEETNQKKMTLLSVIEKLNKAL